MSWKKRIIFTLIATVSLAAAVAGQNKTSPSFSSQDVKIDARGIALAGTLLTPKLESGVRVPAVLIFAEAGAPAVGRTLYGQLAEELAGRGLAVLRFDKRCVGGSECKAPELFSDYVDDGRHVLNFLSKQSGVDADKIFIFGHGEGGLIVASLAGHTDHKFAGVIMAGMSGRTLNKILRDQIQTQLTEAGKSSEQITASLLKFDRMTRSMMSGVNTFPNQKLDQNDLTDAVLLDLINRYQVVISLLINDPLQIVNAIKSPVLILQGRKDIRVAVKDAQFIEEALKRAYHPDATLQIFDDVDHQFRTFKGVAGFAAEKNNTGPIDPAVGKTLADWIDKRAKSEKAAR